MSPENERFARRVFNAVPHFTPLRFQEFLVHFGSASTALQAPLEEWMAVEGFARDRAEKLYQAVQKTIRPMEAEAPLLERLGVRVLIDTDPEYPQALKSIHDPPIVLYVCGEFRPPDAHAVAIVGTRHPTAYGQSAAERLSRSLGEAGVTVVSGLARGIDTASHAASLRTRGRTIGVLGSGFSRFYPPENKSLAEKIKSRGAVITEFSLDTPPDRGNFPRRNRIISGLSLAVVVVEADEKSGALITARLAAEQGRDVMAVPGPIFSKVSRGPHLLLKQGARLVESVEDILEEIEALRNLVRSNRSKTPERPLEKLTEPEETVLSHIDISPVSMDDLSRRTGLSAALLSAVLLGLELKGLIRSLPGQNIVKSERGLASGAAAV